jgi:threonine synthase
MISGHKMWYLVSQDAQSMKVRGGQVKPELWCSLCGSLPAGESAWRCESCGGPFDLESWSSPSGGWPDRGRGLWQFRDWLPVEGAVSLGEPETALVEVGRGVCKLEGGLPTGSFKDRGSAALVSQLVADGVTTIAVDSSGNAGASLAAYCAAAGIAARVYVPASASAAKLVQIEAYGAETVRVPGTRADVAEAAVGDSRIYASHIWSPYFLVGTQTFAFELTTQLGGEPPAAVLFPVGAGTLLLGSYLGFRALRDAGLTDRLPRLYGVQAAACAPFHAAWTETEARPCEGSLAEGLLIARPPRLAAVVAAVRETGGEILAVDESAIASAVVELARHGVYAEPSAAVAWAGFKAVPDEEDAVVALTATGLKATASIEKLIAPNRR